MKNFNPRHMRKRFRKTHSDDTEKKRVFRRVSMWSKQFIHQPASALEKPHMAAQYKKWCDRSRPGQGLR